MTELQDTLELQLALATLAYDPAEADVNALLPNLQHQDRGIRLLTIRVLEELGDPRAIPALLSASADPDESVAEEASAALREFRRSEAFTLLAQGAKHQDARVRRGVIVALRDNFNSLAYSALVPLLLDADADTRREAAIAVAQSPMAQGTELLPLLRDEDANVRRAAINGIAARKADPCGEAIATLLRDPDWQVRADAATALASSARYATIQESLLLGLRDDYWQVAKASISSLAGASPCVTQKLLPFLTHSESDIRIATANALGRIGNPLAAEALRDLRNDPDAGVRKAAARAVEQLASAEGWA